MRKRTQTTVNVLLASTASLFLGLIVDVPVVQAAPTVGGTSGCISAVGQAVGRNVRIAGPGGSENEFRMDICGENNPGWLHGNFVNAWEVNNAFSTQESYINQLNQQTRNDLTSYVDQRVTNASPDLSTINNRLSGHDTQINTINGRLGGHDTQISTINGRLSGHDTKISAAETTIGQHTASLTTQQNAITKNTNDISAVSNRVTDTEQKIVDHEGRIASGEDKNIEQDGRLDAHDARFAAGDQKNAEQDARLDKHDDIISGIDDRVTDSEQKNQEQDLRLDDHDRQLSDHNDRLNDHDAKLDDHETRIVAGEIKDIEQDGRLDDHDTRIGNLEGGVGEITKNAVFYDTDQNGNKKGGLTLNDGTGKEVQLGNVAAGKAGTDAVNVDQLRSATDALGGGSKINEDGSLTAPQYNVGGINYNNVGDALKATNELGVQYVADENGKPTNNIRLTGDGTGPVKMTNVASGTEDSDAVNYGQVKDNIAYDRNEDGSRSNTVTLVGGNPGTVTIRNLADGKANGDAATVRQVNQARQDSFDYTDQRVSELTNQSQQQFSALSGEISKTREESRAGISSALAQAALRYDTRPGKASIAGGFGGFKGTTSMAAGVGYTSLDSNWRVNAAISHSMQTNDTSWSAGASFTFN